MSRFSTPAKRLGAPSLIPAPDRGRADADTEGPTGILQGGGPSDLDPAGSEWVGAGQVVDDDRRSGIGAEVSVANGLRQVQAAGDDVVTVEAEADRGDIGRPSLLAVASRAML